MITKYTHRVTIACPEQLIPAANQLALISGESVDDDQTFSNASYEDASGNKFAICSTVVTGNFLAIQSGLPAELPVHAENADVTLAQQSLDALVIWDSESTFDQTKLTMAIGPTPQDALASMGITAIQVDVI